MSKVECGTFHSLRTNWKTPYEITLNKPVFPISRRVLKNGLAFIFHSNLLDWIAKPSVLPSSIVGGLV